MPRNHSHAPACDKNGGIRKVTLIGAIFDCPLGLLKVAVGIAVRSAALVADGIYSFSDLVSGGLVLAVDYFGNKAADRSHPYGHGRIETLATQWLGSILLAVAVWIA